MSKFNALCKGLAGFNTIGAQSVRFTFCDASLDHRDADKWIWLTDAVVDKSSDPMSASAWDQVLDRMLYYARRHGAFDVDMEAIPIYGQISPKEIRRINMKCLKDINMIERIKVIVNIDDAAGYTYTVCFSSDTGLPDKSVWRVDSDGKFDKIVSLSGPERKGLSSFEALKKYF